MSGDTLRVGVVVPRFWPFVGGVESYTEQAAGALVARGARVTVITQVPRASRLPARAERHGYEIERYELPVRGLFDVPSPAAVRAATRPGRFDVLWLHSYHTPLAWLVAELAPAPVVLTPHYHGTGHTPLRAALHRPYRLLGRRLLGTSRRVVVDTDAEAALVRRHFSPVVPATKLDVVPLPVEPPPSAPPFPGGQEPVVLTVARQEAYKRTDVLVRAVARMRDRGLPVRLVVVGAGRALPDLRRLVQGLRLGDVVTVTGAVDDQTLARWWATARCYATASSKEAFGISAAQALAAGLPVVASDIPAHREVVASAGPDAVASLVPDERRPELTADRYAQALAAVLYDSPVRRGSRLPLGDRTAASTALLEILRTAAA